MTREEFMKLPFEETNYYDGDQCCIKDDLLEIEKGRGQKAEWVRVSGQMALAKFGDIFEVFGFDGEEYYREYTF